MFFAQPLRIKYDDDCRNKTCEKCGLGLIHQIPHDISSAGEHHKRNDGERKPETEYYLAHDQRVGGIQSRPDNNQRRGHGNQAAKPYWDMPLKKSLHDDLTCAGSNC